MATTTTFLTLCNDAILESGSDLASFATDGSDFDTPTVNQLKRFKKWVQTAWLDVQQEVPDWHFMMHEAEVTTNPGIMFYTESSNTIPDKDLSGVTVDILDQDDTTIESDVPLLGSVNLTSELDETKQFGYLDIETTSTTPIDYGLKVGNYYFMFPPKYSYSLTNITTGGFPAIAVAEVVDLVLTRPDASIDRITDGATITAIAGSDVSFTSYVALGSYTHIDLQRVSPFALISSSVSTAVTTTTATAAFKCYIHSWKSLDFSEESGDEDFLKSIKQINQSSFSLIDPYSAPPGTRYNLQTLSWEQFRNSYDRPSDMPSQPLYISEDVNGRWRMYPNPKQKYTLRFTFQANPQDLVEFDDIPKGIPEEFVDIIMWGALVYYGEYSETPSIAIRAKRQYDRMMAQLQFQKRPKFALKPVRLY